MFARLTFLLAICLGLAVAPVRPVLACESAPVANSCGHCCAAPGKSCCAVSSGPAESLPVAPSSASSDAGKLLPAPTLYFLCLSPLPVAEQPAVHRQHAARLPVLPLLDRHCIRLI